MKPTALIDLDGTLADFHGAMTRDLRRMRAQEEVFDFNPDAENEHSHLKARYDAIKSQPDWWFNLEPIEQGFRVLEMLKQLDFKLHVCTRASMNLPQCWAEKVRWVKKYLPGTKMTITQDKSLVQGAVLMDDWVGYVKPWLKQQSQGLVIMPDRSWNQDFAHANVIRHGADEVVFEALKRKREQIEDARLRLEHGIYG
jgi:5'-nucleotidase